MNYWEQKVVMITGASSGIGRALSLRLGSLGAAVGLVARNAEVLKEIATTIGLGKGRAVALPADVRDIERVRAITETLRATFGRIDVVIANAGIGGTTEAARLDVEQIAWVINVNMMGAANCVAAAIPEMLDRGSGHLVVISSLAAYRGLPKSGAYCASKAAVSAFFESLRLELQPKGIDVTIIHPGFIKTPLTADREAKMPFLMELEDAIDKIITAIERRRTSYAFPWQLAGIVRAGVIMPDFMYDWLARRNSFRE